MPLEIEAMRASRPGAAARRTYLAAALLLGAAALGHFGYQYSTTGQYLVSTDDAYVKADSTTIHSNVLTQSVSVFAEATRQRIEDLTASRPTSWPSATPSCCSAPRS